MLLILGFVDRMFDRWACRWPFVVASRLGGHRRICSGVIVGKEWGNPTLIASVSVDRVGEKRDLWKKVIHSAMVGASTTTLSE